MLGREIGTIGGVYKGQLVSDQPNNLLICHSERSEASSSCKPDLEDPSQKKLQDD